MLKKTTQLPHSLEAFIISKVAIAFVRCILILVAAGVAFADDPLPTIQFAIKPRHCVLSEGEEVCQDELEITWNSRYRRSLCLFRSDVGAAIKCWENTFSGSHNLEISASKNVDFQLKESKDESLLVTEAFEVVQDNAKYRRRRKNAWSFF